MKAKTEPGTSEQPLNADFERLYEDHSDLVYRAAYSVLGCREDAEDVTQRVFVTLMRGFSPALTRNLKAYLYRAAVNHARCLIRCRGRRKFMEYEIEEDVPDPATETDEHNIRGPLLDAMAELKSEVAQMLILRYEQDYTDAQIAQMTGSSRVRVAVALNRGRARLRKLIEGQEGAKHEAR